jgi:hypothetical protein
MPGLFGKLKLAICARRGIPRRFFIFFAPGKACPLDYERPLDRCAGCMAFCPR